MKTFTFTLLLTHTIYGYGQNPSTISNGNWNDPSIWSTNVVPDEQVDTILIYHSVEMTSDLHCAAALLINGGCLTDGPIEYDLYIDTLVNGQPAIVNLHGNGYIEVRSIRAPRGWFSFADAVAKVRESAVVSLLQGAGEMTVGDTLTITNFFGALQLNENFGTINGAETYLTCNHFVNNSSVHMANNTSFCIQNAVINNGTIFGQWPAGGDFCDATPNGAGDLNNGTIDPTFLTLCTNSNCGVITHSCASISSVNNGFDKLMDLNVYPNPASDQVNIELGVDFKNPIIRIFDTHGRQIKSINTLNEKVVQFDTKDTPNGIYYLNVHDASHSKSVKLIINR